MAERPPIASSAKRFAPPVLARGLPLVVLLALFLGAGLIGHDPWKNEDAIHFGVVWRAALDGEWRYFHLAFSGTPEPPLYYWVARASAALLAVVLGFADAVRVASLLFTAAACGLLYLAARDLYGPEAAPAAPLALAGCLGFLIQSHETQAALATVAALCALLAGLAALGARRSHATPLLACGLAALFLADGLALLPAMVALCAASALLAMPGARLPQLSRLGIALLGAVLLVLPWALSLQSNGTSAWAAFLGDELARLAGVASPLRNAWRHLEQLLWFAWPALPLAGWGLWSRRHAWRSAALWQGSIAFVLLWATLSWTTEARAAPALLLLPPLALLAVQGVMAMRRGAANGFDWFARLTFALIVLLIWFGWFAMHYGLPPKVAHNILRLSPGYAPQIEPAAVALALAATLAWLWLIVREPRNPLRSLAHWTAGTTLTWLLVVSLWLPWIDYLKSYRSVGLSLAAILPPTASCIETRGMGEPQHAALEYALDRRFNPQRDTGCRYLLVQGNRQESLPESEWRKVWEGHRPGDRNERLRLYHRG